MYHARFKQTHYKAGFHWGHMLKKHGISLCEKFQISEERINFMKGCLPIYKKYYPEILEEIKGIANGQHSDFDYICTFLLSMYCFEFSNHCTCIAFKDDRHILFGRNSDFLIKLEKDYMNCLYSLENVYAFNGNTTAFVEMEDGMNENGLAVGLTFVYPKVKEYGLNAGMLVRFILEKCKTTQEALSFLKNIPIASQQVITLIDANGDMETVECNPYIVEIIPPKKDKAFIVSTNDFYSTKMIQYKNDKNIDDWKAKDRYQVAYTALQTNSFSFDLLKNILSGKYGFMCQYDRKKEMDTVWSVIYDVKNQKIYRVEGNPSRKQFKEDTRQKKK